MAGNEGNNGHDGEIDTDDDLGEADAAAARRFADSYRAPCEDDDGRDFAPPRMCSGCPFFSTQYPYAYRAAFHKKTKPVTLK